MAPRLVLLNKNVAACLHLFRNLALKKGEMLRKKRKIGTRGGGREGGGGRKREREGEGGGK